MHDALFGFLDNFILFLAVATQGYIRGLQLVCQKRWGSWTIFDTNEDLQNLASR
jgi:hypothetical protein